ncbi:hypothetical protein [Haloarchaeobius sp. TZWWS8]|uniref:hypothetical protein n=1 Tax=Haloarchaeobius sp. TZWWS8 TaxID=3446121 RepID=UPI003EB7A985
MNDRPVVRFCLVCLLLGTVGFFMLDYAAEADSQSHFPTDPELERSYPAYHGERVHVWLDVVETTEDGFVGDFGDGVTFRVTDASSGVEPGDTVQVYGTAGPDRRIDASRVVVSDGENVRYMLGVSVLSVLLTLGAVFSHWRFVPGKLQFTPRGGADTGRDSGRP